MEYKVFVEDNNNKIKLDFIGNGLVCAGIDTNKSIIMKENAIYLLNNLFSFDN